MVRPGRDCLSGTVEIDETYVGGPEKDKWGREIDSKAIVAVAAEENGQGIGRIRMRRIEDVSGASLLPFVQSAVAPGATIHTDGWNGYAGLKAAGYKHRVSVISTSRDPAHEVMPRVHKVASLLKRWLLGTHQGGIQRQHLDYYLDEFTFRFNRRRSNSRGLCQSRPVRAKRDASMLKMAPILPSQIAPNMRSKYCSRPNRPRGGPPLSRAAFGAGVPPRLLWL
jgi:transposase-like protein